MSFRRPKTSEFPFFENGMDFHEIIDLTFLKPGCREPDCIPSIDHPQFIGKEGTMSMWDENQTVLVLLNPNDPDEAYAAPKSVMDLHEIVNFNFNDGQPVALTYCPLCDTSTSYVREIEDEEVILGVSGLLYNSAVIVYDRKTKSLFSQVYSLGVHGKYKGKQLNQLPMIETTLLKFFTDFPDGTCLSENTGYPRRQERYRGSPYHKYRSTDDVHFPIRDIDQELPVKSSVFHLAYNGEDYIISKELTSSSNQLTDQIYVHPYRGGVLFFSGERGAGINFDHWIPSTISYYFAARAYFPDAKLLK